MFTNARTRTGDLWNRLASPAQYLIVGLFVIIGFALAYMAAASCEQADAGYSASPTRSDVEAKEATKQVILQWMKERSAMSEQVLSKVYGAAMNSVNADLVLAICLVESNFNPRVESEKGAIGLMGIMPDVWLQELKERGIVRQRDDLYGISGNVNSGVYVLGRYLARTNDLREALIRYSGGDPSYAVRVLRMLGEISRVRRAEDQPRLVALRTDDSL